MQKPSRVGTAQSRTPSRPAPSLPSSEPAAKLADASDASSNPPEALPPPEQQTARRRRLTTVKDDQRTGLHINLDPDVAMSVRIHALKCGQSAGQVLSHVWRTYGPKYKVERVDRQNAGATSGAQSETVSAA